jgi:hypothetical protein
MTVAQALADFKASVAQCESLIANAHRTDAGGTFLFPETDQKQITIAAFLNLRIVWENFLESTMVGFLTGKPTISGSMPLKYVAPPNAAIAHAIIKGTQKYFDYGAHEHVRKMISLYFKDGYPYEPHLRAIVADLEEIRTIRNACAHKASSTQIALEAIALRIFGAPKPNISVYDLITAADPRSTTGETVFSSYKAKLVLAAELIANGLGRA